MRSLMFALTGVAVLAALTALVFGTLAEGGGKAQAVQTVTITAEANGLVNPAIASCPLTNGDFEISLFGANVPPCGDGINEVTRWTLIFTGDSGFPAFKDCVGPLTSARLTLTMTPGTGIGTDDVGITGLGRITRPGVQTLYNAAPPDLFPLLPGDTRTITVDFLTSPLSAIANPAGAAAILGVFEAPVQGRIPMVYQDDAIISFARLELTKECPPPVIDKTLLEGPDEIGIYLPGPTQYVFEITYTGPTAAKVIDTVPAEFECVSLVPTAGTATCSDTSRGAGNSANRIEWDVPAGSNTLTVTIQTVASPGKGHKEGVVFKPTSCGPLPINDGATAFEVDPVTGELVLVVVVDPVTGEITLEPVVIVGPSNSLVVEAVEGAKPCEPVGCAGAVFDICVDGDGIASAGAGAFQIAVGDAVLPAGAGGNPAGLDLIDRGLINGVYDAGDDLMVEDPIGTPTCPTALRDAVYNNVPGGPQDCVVLDPDGTLADGDFVTCDAGAGCGLSFRDDDGDGRYDEGEDLIVDVNGNGVFD